MPAEAISRSAGVDRRIRPEHKMPTLSPVAEMVPQSASASRTASRSRKTIVQQREDQ